MKIVKITEIHKNPDNPRIIRDVKFKKLVQSLKDFPEMMSIRPIVVNTDMMILGGNMRYEAAKAAGWEEVPVEIVDLPEDKQKEFVIKDNLGYGEWNWEVLANDWDAELLGEWGVEKIEFENVRLTDGFGEEFTLTDGDKPPFQQITFTLADEQAEVVRRAVDSVKRSYEFKYCESFGNQNSNGNALYLIIKQWGEQRRL